MSRVQPPSLDRLAPLAAEQDGYFTTAQARIRGVSDSRLVRLVEEGYLERVLHRVYRVTIGVPVAPRVRADLYVRYLALDDKRLPWDSAISPRVVVSHESAAELWRIGNLPADDARFTSERRRTTTIPSVRITTAQLPDEEWQFMHEGRIPVTTAARTVVDLALSGVGHDYVERAATDALDARVMTVSELRSAIERRKRPALHWLDRWLEQREGAQ